MNIHIPNENAFDQKAKQFFESKEADRLRRKYESKPYQARFRPVYYLSIFTSYLGNIFSIITASTFVFSYLLSIVRELPYPAILAGTFTLCVLVCIEVLQRILGKNFFMVSLQSGVKLSLLVPILTLSIISVTFSFKGSFDMVKTVLSPPEYIKPELQGIQTIRNEYNALITDAGNDADEYKDRKLWNGRLSDKHAQVYNELLQRKDNLRNAMITTIAQAEENNRQSISQANTDHEAALAEYQTNTQAKGSGLGIAAIIAQLIFFLSIFYMEYYDLRVASQYAVLDSNDQKQSFFFNNQTQKTGHPKRNPNGFFSKKQEDPVLEHVRTEKQVVLDDLYTVSHISKITGEEKRYTLQQLNGIIRTYTSRLEEAELLGDQKLVASRRKSLRYWEGKRKTLMGKIPLNV